MTHLNTRRLFHSHSYSILMHFCYPFFSPYVRGFFLMKFKINFLFVLLLVQYVREIFLIVAWRNRCNYFFTRTSSVDLSRLLLAFVVVSAIIFALSIKLPLFYFSSLTNTARQYNFFIWRHIFLVTSATFSTQKSLRD